MQVFSGRVCRGSEPDSTRTNCFTYPIPNQYLIFHTRSTPTKLLPAYMLGLSAQIFSKHSDYESAHMIIEDWPRHCHGRMLHSQYSMIATLNLTTLLNHTVAHIFATHDQTSENMVQPVVSSVWQ